MIDQRWRQDVVRTNSGQKSHSCGGAGLWCSYYILKYRYKAKWKLVYSMQYRKRNTKKSAYKHTTGRKFDLIYSFCKSITQFFVAFFVNLSTDSSKLFSGASWNNFCKHQSFARSWTKQRKTALHELCVYYDISYVNDQPPSTLYSV